jgi:hypothetical protein
MISYRLLLGKKYVYKVKVKQSHDRSGQALRVPEVEAPRFQDSWHRKVIRMSALGTGCLYPPVSIPGANFC